jgi:hypothetical protein
MGFRHNFAVAARGSPPYAQQIVVGLELRDAKISPDFSDNFALNPGNGLVRFTPPRDLKTAASQGHRVRFFASFIVLA